MNQKGKERVTFANYLQVCMCLDLMRLKFEENLQEMKNDSDFINTLLETNMFNLDRDPLRSGMKHSLQQSLIDNKILPPLPRADEDWDLQQDEDDDNSNNSDSGNSSNTTDTNTTDTYVVNWDEIRNQPTPYSSLIKTDREDFETRFVLKQTLNREELFLFTGLHYFLQIYSDIRTARLCFKNHLYNATVNYAQQATEKVLKSILICVRRVGYLDCINEHNLGAIARKIQFNNSDLLRIYSDEFEATNSSHRYSSLSVRTKYPPKNFGLKFTSAELPCLSFKKIDAEISLLYFLAIFYTSIEALAPVILKHFPSGQIYFSELNAIITLKGTNLLYPEDLEIEMVDPIIHKPSPPPFFLIG